MRDFEARSLYLRRNLFIMPSFLENPSDATLASLSNDGSGLVAKALLVIYLLLYASHRVNAIISMQKNRKGEVMIIKG